jgi:Arc/MetJ family transcription regulator
MATRVAIDERLLDEAHEISGCATKAETVNEALREFIQRRKQLDILKLSSKVDFDDMRQRKRS